MALLPHSDALFSVTSVVDGPVRFPLRMTVVRLSDGGLWLHSPVPIDTSLADELDRLGSVRAIVAPNAFHHAYVADAVDRYPDAAVYAAAGLRKKRPDLRVDRWLDETPVEAWAADLDPIHVEGAPMVDETVFLHRPSRSLIVTDLVFNVRRVDHLLSQLVFRLTGTYGRFAQSRLWRWMLAKDRAAVAQSCRSILDRDFDRIVLPHGDVIETDGKARLATALAPMLGAVPALPAAGTTA